MCLRFFFMQKTAHEMRISDWSSDVALPIYSAPIRLIGATLLPPPILDPTPPPGSSLTRTPTRPDSAEDALRRELYLFALYRTLEAALLAVRVFSSFGGLFGEPRDPFLAMAVAIALLPDVRKRPRTKSRHLCAYMLPSFVCKKNQ